MTDTTAAAPADPGPPPTAPPGMPTGSDRFFSWVEGLGVVRADAWLGGVCGGIAARLRIDPLIVRGIFVVVALFGFPALLVYAIAWAVLPDTSGRVHLRELFHGRYDAAMTGVFILAFIGFVPVVPWLRNILMWPLWALTGFAPWAWADGAGVSVFGVLGIVFGLAVLGGLVFLIVRAAQAAPGSADAAPLAADDIAGAAPASAPAPVGDDAQVADWRVRQDAWRTQNDAWRRSQQDAARAAREQARRERHAHGAAFALEAEERRRARRAGHPRTSFAFVLTALGAALVAGAVAVLTAASGSQSETAPYAAAIGLFTAALVTALAMVVAGVIRRRSGFLTAVTIVLLVIGGSVAAASGPQRLVIGSVELGTASYEQAVLQPFGSTFISVDPLSTEDDVEAGGVTVTKGAGGTDIVVSPGTALELDATLGDGVVSYTRVPGSDGGDPESGTVRPDGDGRISWRTVNEDPASDAVTTQHVALNQRTGSIQVTIHEK